MYFLPTVLCLSLALGGDVSAGDLVKEAQAHLAKKEAGKALASINEALKLDPKNVQAYFVRGEANGLLDRHVEAVADYSRVLQLDPSAVEAFDLRGSANFKAGRP